VGLGHQVHHKFVVCGFNGKDPVVYCGSSNLALGGEKANGDNLLAIHDEDIATVFAIEALGLVDHFEFLDRHAIETGKKEAAAAEPNSASKSALADAAGWFLSTDDDWGRTVLRRGRPFAVSIGSCSPETARGDWSGWAPRYHGGRIAVSSRSFEPLRL
jgi:hypothetical protein